MRKSLILTFAAVMLIASLPADAGGRGHPHGHSHARVGVFIGAPLLFAPWYYPYASSYYYSPPPVVVRERVVVREPLVFYDERGNPVPAQGQVAQAPAPAQTQSPAPSPSATPAWYFCADTQTYYPYAQTCASPWQRVIPHPPPQ